MTVLNHLRKAADHLEQAQQEADLGSGLMIQPIREELLDLIERTDNINDDTDG